MSEPMWRDFDHTLDRRYYVEHILEAYRTTPICAGKVRREDRRLAHRLYDQRTPLRLVRAAFYLAAMRRLYRPFDATPLPPVRALHYFLPVLDEIRRHDIDPHYIAYAEQKVRNVDRDLERIRDIIKQRRPLR